MKTFGTIQPGRYLSLEEALSRTDLATDGNIRASRRFYEGTGLEGRGACRREDLTCGGCQTYGKGSNAQVPEF